MKLARGRHGERQRRENRGVGGAEGVGSGEKLAPHQPNIGGLGKRRKFSSGARRGAPVDNNFWYLRGKEGRRWYSKDYILATCWLLIFVFDSINGRVMLCTYNNTQLTVHNIARLFHQLKTQTLTAGRLQQ
jgi:hypothetical protein